MPSRSFTFVQQAGPNTRFALDQFSKQLGQTITVAEPEYSGTATLRAAIVADDRRSAKLTVDLPPL